jgi:hypothetical protein
MYRYPLDRTDELRRTGYDVAALIAEARRNGYRISRRTVRAWIRTGALPPPMPRLTLVPCRNTDQPAPMCT